MTSHLLFFQQSMKRLFGRVTDFFCGFARSDDAYEQENLSKLAVEKRRVETLRRFIGDFSHDLRTPLATIKVDLYLLRKKVMGPEETFLYLDKIEGEVNYLTKLLEDLGSVSRSDDTPSRYEFEPLDVNSLMRGIVTGQEAVVAQRSQKLEFVPGTNLPTILADQVNLWRALLNVVSNAVCYTPERGTIRVSTRDQETWVVVEVQDSGIGIAPDDLPHIFERFYRAREAQSTKTGGSGLGLAIAKRVIEAHAGKIEVESTPGQGSIFRILLPAMNHRSG